MNIIKSDNKCLHKKFLKVGIGDHDYLIQQAVVTYSKEDIFHVSKLCLVVEDEPEVHNNLITIKGLGNIKGRLYEENEQYYIAVI